MDEKEILVTASMTLSKTFTIKVSDYELKTEGYDEDIKYTQSTLNNSSIISIYQFFFISLHRY